ncbi:Uncharacterised protein [Vibrio cholerae]|uniref:Uncharacterized protein n=1 Tax=Vibrio cholerae TaxID=666 RepID=A0A655TPR3_VIBCL|nr:Uncharacterised protein [Vibrio cholerae]CSA27725.1 Uncharacterised protein [Vibrio cholerae]CSA54104.1 Uncharacterised protein [Vibrio cholerae]CSB38327.1 Uncharacterised protein [Vibrio cholerae]CSB82974.1 Uncharacterised protein [Vibrio cholerae]
MQIILGVLFINRITVLIGTISTAEATLFHIKQQERGSIKPETMSHSLDRCAV